MSDKIEVFSVRDSVLAKFMMPFFSQNVAAAVRTVSEIVSDPGHTFHMSAEDYCLYHLGSFDLVNGVLVPATHVDAVSQLALLRAPKAVPGGERVKLLNDYQEGSK